MLKSALVHSNRALQLLFWEKDKVCRCNVSNKSGKISLSKKHEDVTDNNWDTNRPTAPSDQKRSNRKIRTSNTGGY